MKKFADTVRHLLSIALNLFIVWAEPIALPMSWDWGKEQMFIFYTEDSNILSACICAMVAVGQLVCIFTGRELPRWLHTQGCNKCHSQRDSNKRRLLYLSGRRLTSKEVAA